MAPKSGKPASTKKLAATHAKADKKSVKASARVEEVEVEAPVVDAEELEEQEDAAAAQASGQNGNAAAMAAAGGNTEMSASFKNFRHHPDMENFYRFIFENDLRHEALAIIDEIMVEKLQRRMGKGPKNPAH